MILFVKNLSLEIAKLTKGDYKMDVIQFKDIVEKNGRTVYENNMNKKHKFPIGSKVYLELETLTTAGPKFEKGIYTVFSHDRDCDGTPIYALISESINVIKGWKDFIPNIEEIVKRIGGFGYINGISENTLMEIPQMKDQEYSKFLIEEFGKNYNNNK